MSFLDIFKGSNRENNTSVIQEVSTDISDISNVSENKSFGGYGGVGGVLINSNFDGGNFSRLSKSNAVDKNTGWLYGITSLIASNVAYNTLCLYAKTDEQQGKIANYKTIKPSMINKIKLNKSISNSGDIEQLVNHPAEVLLHTVNNYMDGFNLMYTTQLWLDIIGDCYWYIVKDKSGIPTEIHIINPLFMTVVPNEKQTKIMGYIYKSTGNSVSFDVDEIVRFTAGSLTGKWYGQSPIMAIGHTIEMMEQIDKLELAMLKNYGVPPLALIYKNDLNVNQIRQLEVEWKKSTTNKNAGGVKVINGDVSIEKIAQSISEMMFTEQTIVNIKQIAFCYGVPYSFIDSTSQLKAGLDQMLEMFARNCLQPRLKRIEESLNQQYIPMFDDSSDMFFKFEDPSPENKKNDADIYTSYVNAGILSVDEVRETLGYPPKENDETDETDKTYENDEPTETV